MVKYILIFVWLPLCAFAGEFIASVNRTQIGSEESVTLNLTLKDTPAKSVPSLSPLNKSFVISAQQQSSNTIMHNGQISSTISWKLTLIPLREGELIIPSISIATPEGTLATEPITIRVVKGAPSSVFEASDTEGLTLTTEVSNPNPYQQEPFFYTVKLTTKRNISNIKIQKIEVENGIVEATGEPKVYETMVDGTHVGVVEFNYLITPLKAGTLKIPSTLVQGVMPMRRKPHAFSMFDDDDFSPLAMMTGFDLLKPFVQMTEDTTIEIQPSIADMNPWIPARSLRIEEMWDDQVSLQVGEPFTRGFKVIAEGIASSQLPSLSDLQLHDSSFKLYADKPVLNDEFKPGIIRSSRTEQYTLIPQQPGSLTLPAISIAWWNASKRKQEVAYIPARTVQILPATDALAYHHRMETPAESLSTMPMQEKTDTHPWIYVLGGLVVVLLIAILWGVALQLKIMRLQKGAMKPDGSKAAFATAELDEKKHTSIKNKEKREKLPDLNPT